MVRILKPSPAYRLSPAKSFKASACQGRNPNSDLETIPCAVPPFHLLPLSSQIYIENQIVCSKNRWCFWLRLIFWGWVLVSIFNFFDSFWLALMDLFVGWRSFIWVMGLFLFIFQYEHRICVQNMFEITFFLGFMLLRFEWCCRWSSWYNPWKSVGNWYVWCPKIWFFAQRLCLCLVNMCFTWNEI